MSDNTNNCNHKCTGCEHADENGNCQTGVNDMLFPCNEASYIKKMIGIVSGKGGVGKSLVTGISAVAASRAGFVSGILDADITGPSMPKMFGLEGILGSNGKVLIPAQTENGIEMISTNLLLEHPEDPVVWRGPVITGLLRQFYTDTAWGNLDVLFCDMPPGTGDVPLTVFQSFPLDGIIIVTSPQSLVSQIVEKAVKMARLMNVPILGIVENFSYAVCSHCGEKINVFGESSLESIAEKYNLPVIGRLPIDPLLAKACDDGKIEDYSTDEIKEFSSKLLSAIDL